MPTRTSSPHARSLTGPVPFDLLLLILAAIAVLIGITVFSLLPDTVAPDAYRVPVLSSLVTLVFAALGNLLVGLVQKGVSKEAARALSDPIDDLRDSVEQLRQIQLFFDAGLIGVYPDRSSAMRRFQAEIEREDVAIDFVGTSMQGSIDPGEENDDKKALHDLLRKRKQSGARIRALLMHPAYGEFRERVENRERAAVARDIQATLRYLLPTEGATNGSREAVPAKLIAAADVRLYPGVTTAFAIFTRRAMLVNVSTLHGPVYDNVTFIFEDTDNPTSIFKKFRANHFEKPWASEKTVRLDDEQNETLTALLELDFGLGDTRFREGNWPATIRSTEPVVDAKRDATRPASSERSGDGLQVDGLRSEVPTR